MEGGKKQNSSADGVQAIFSAINILSNVVVNAAAEDRHDDITAWEPTTDASLSTPLYHHDGQEFINDFERLTGGHQQMGADVGCSLQAELPVIDVSERDFRSNADAEMAATRHVTENHAKRPRMDSVASVENDVDNIYAEIEARISTLGRENAVETTFDMGDYLVFNNPPITHPPPQSSPITIPSRSPSPAIRASVPRRPCDPLEEYDSGDDFMVKPKCVYKAKGKSTGTGKGEGKGKGKAKSKSKINSKRSRQPETDKFVPQAGPSGLNRHGEKKNNVQINKVSAQVEEKSSTGASVLEKLLKSGVSKPAKNPAVKPPHDEVTRTKQVKKVSDSTKKSIPLPKSELLPVPVLLPEPSTSAAALEVGRSNAVSPDLFEEDQRADEEHNHNPVVDAFSQESEKGQINNFIAFYTDLRRKRTTSRRDIEDAVNDLERRRACVVRRRAHVRRIEGLIDRDLLRQLRDAERLLKETEEDVRHGEEGLAEKRRVYDKVYAKLHSIESRMPPPSQ